MRQPKSMRNVHAAKSHISTESRMVRTGYPFEQGEEAGDAGRRGQPGSRDTLANAEPSPISKQEEKSHLESRVRLAFVRRARPARGGHRRLRGSRRPSSSPHRRWAAPRSSSAARSRRTAHPPRLCFWPTSP